MKDRVEEEALGATMSAEVPETLVLPAGEGPPGIGTDGTQLARGSDVPNTVVARPRPVIAKGSVAGKDDGGGGGGGGGKRDDADGERYEVLDEIGRGGLGRVVRATDRKLARTVAIKQLHRRDDDLERRFLGEAMVTAQLQHPSIVSVYDTGRHGGAPFYAMKLVAGRSLAEVIAETEALAGRLALLPSVLAVANAVAFAHHAKVIHRDLKPHNVIVGEFGETVVIDWGLAKQLGGGDDAASLRPLPGSSTDTALGDVLGTPGYMPPEQARGEALDERADVFALGAILYHLLARRPPYSGPTTDVTVGLARLGKSAPLASLAPDAPPDLVAIANKAMALDPAGRYATAAEFAEDLDKFLTGRLVGSHRYSSWELVRRWIRRNRVTVAVAVALLAILAVASALFVRQIMHERDVADAERATAETQRAEAVKAKTEADTRRAAADELVGYMLTELRPGLTRVGRLDLMRGVAGQVDAYYARISTVDQLDADAAARRAEAIRTLGEVLDVNGQLDQARRAFERAIATLTAKGGVPLATAQVDLALVLQEQNDIAGALALLRKIPDALAKQSGAAVDHVLARAYRRIGILEASRGKLDDAKAALDQAIAHAEAAIKADAKLRAARAELAASRDRLADVYEATAKLPEAIAQVRAGLAIREALHAEDPGDIDVRQGIAVSWDKLYYFALASNDLAGADKAAAESLAIAELLATIDAANDDWARQLYIARERPARLAYERDDGAKAVALQEKALEISEQRAKRSPDTAAVQSDLADTLAHLGDYLTLAKQPDRAIEILRRAQKIEEELMRKDGANLDYKRGAASLHELIGSVFFELKEYRAAADEYRSRMALDEELVKLEKDNPRRKVDLASTQFLTGIATTYLPGRRDEGLALARAAVATFKELDKAGLLTPDMQQTLPEREKQIAERARP